MKKTVASASLALAAVVALTGCSTGATGAAEDESIRVVASTNVYGQIAAQIGGERIEVTSLIDSAAQDPHGYEATARDRLAVQRADLVIENGGGYDAFMTELIEGSDATIITAVEFSHDYPDAVVEAHDGHDGEDHAEHAEDDAHDAHAEDDAHDAHADHGHIAGFNEHVWFDVHTMKHVAEQVAAELAELDPAGKAEYTAAAEGLGDDLGAIEGELAALHERLEATPVMITEPLPGLLAASAGLDDVTPEGFASAVEEGNEVAPATLLKALSLVEQRHVRAVLVTAQTGGSETARIEAAAKAAGIPVISFSELLDADQTYAEWMRAAITDLTAALDA